MYVHNVEATHSLEIYT